MNSDNNYETGLESTPPSTLEVDVGRAMPSAQARRLPVMNAPIPFGDAAEPTDDNASLSKLAEGLQFTGNVVLRGACSIAGNVQGNIAQAQGSHIAVIITPTGSVNGDITAQKISVMGRTNGILDAGQGEVSLHDSARVQGLVRYGRIQVNGADLNATLERVRLANTGR